MSQLVPSRLRHKPISYLLPFRGLNYHRRSRGCRTGMVESSSMPTTRSRRRCSSLLISMDGFSTEIVASLVPGARVVKAFNHLLAAILSGDPHAEGGERVLFYSGDDETAKAEVAALIAKLGFAGVDLGPLSIGGRLTQFPGGPLPANNFVKFA